MLHQKIEELIVKDKAGGLGAKVARTKVVRSRFWRIRLLNWHKSSGSWNKKITPSRTSISEPWKNWKKYKLDKKLRMLKKNKFRRKDKDGFLNLKACMGKWDNWRKSCFWVNKTKRKSKRNSAGAWRFTTNGNKKETPRLLKLHNSKKG